MANFIAQYLQTNLTIKLRFPSPLTRNYWAIEEPSQKKLYAVPFVGALMAVACAKPIFLPTLFESLTSKFHIDIEQAKKTLKCLISKKIIVSVEKDCNSTFDDFLSWTKFGWDDAANYHFFTWDAPFLDYTKEGGGHNMDRKKMIGYQELQPDTERYKKYDTHAEIIQLPALNFSLSNEQIRAYSISTKIKHLLAIVFGKKEEKSCHWTDTPLIRKTSPSGGSRHPSEGYFFSSALQDIKAGFYHVQTDPISLCLISVDHHHFLENSIMERNFAHKLIGAIVLTSVFERNMYRYREPRTFRTIHMDIGHILATIEMLGVEFGIKTCIHLKFSETSILQQIGASKLEEGVMAVVTLHEETN